MMLIRFIQPAKALSPIVITELGMVRLVRPLQPEKALFPIMVTELGMLILVIETLLINAFTPIVVTGRLFKTAGIFTAPPGPLYPVIVTEVPSSVKYKGPSC